MDLHSLHETECGKCAVDDEMAMIEIGDGAFISCQHRALDMRMTTTTLATRV